MPKSRTRFKAKKKLLVPDWVDTFNQIVSAALRDGGFERTERYGDDWNRFHVKPLVEAALMGDRNSTFLALGFLEGTIAKLEEEIKQLKEDLVVAKGPSYTDHPSRA